jgi:hypothetical protein
LRWNVHGTDVITGQPVMLAVEESEATHAVQAALSKRIVVSHVTREGVRRALFPLACAGVIVLGGFCAWLIQRENAAHAELAALRTAEFVARTETVLKPAATTPVVTAANSDPQRDDTKAALAALTERLNLTQGQAAQLEAEGTHLKLQQQKAAEALAAQIRITQTDEQKAAEASERAARAENTLGSLTQVNKELTGQVDTLKSQLLASAAKPLAESRAEESAAADVGNEPSPRSTPLRWALRTSYDTASDFVAMHFEKDSMQTEPLPDGTAAWSATSSANAATVRVTHDREKRRVYAATLTVSLATDAPKEKLGENLQLVIAFLRAFAPGVKDAESRANNLVNQLANKDASERSVLVGTDTRVTVWNNGAGLYSWRAESVGNDLAQ